MRSWLCHATTGEDGLALAEVPEPDCQPGQVLIDNHCAALNFPDALMLRGLYQFKPELPFVPGSELAGTVRAVGDGVEGFHVGQRVLALPGFGACSDVVAVSPPMQQLHAMPDSMGFEEASGFAMTYGTAMHALVQRGQLHAGETVLVLGAAGGCGSAAIQIAKALGARVIAAVSTDAKQQAAEQLGADDVVNYKTQDLRDAVKALTDGASVDVVFDPVGDAMFEQAIRCVGWNGRYLVVGFAGGEIPVLKANYTIIKSLSVIGVAFGMSAINDPAMNAENFARLFDWYEQGLVKPLVSETYSIEQLPEAMAGLYAGNAIGKLVVRFSS